MVRGVSSGKSQVVIIRELVRERARERERHKQKYNEMVKIISQQKIKTVYYHIVLTSLIVQDFRLYALTTRTDV